MKFPLLRTVAVAAALTLAACAGTATTPSATTPAASGAAAAFWPQDASDLKADPSLRFGVASNGMRYVLMKNGTPAGQASIRLHFATGSLMEADDQQGLAHFIEHLAFNGSTNVPEGEMIRMLERFGLQFGPDTNAFTSFDQTVYMLDVPSVTAESLETALFLMRETAGELLLDAAAIDRERGVVLSEERTRDTPGLRVARAQFDFLLPGQLAPKRFPIGDTEVLRTAQRQRFVDLYRAYYRPERATLVVVGDIDLDAVEADIRTRFASWSGVGPAGTDPDLGKLAARGPDTRLVVEPGAGSSVQIYWMRPYVERPDTSAERSRDTVRDLAFAVLNRRLERIAREADAPFISAGASSGDFVRSAEITSVVASARPGRHADALAAIEREQRRLVQYGVTQAELDREITEYRAGLTAAVAGAATRRTPALASGVVSALNERDVFTHPADDLAVFEAAVRGLAADAVSAAARDTFTGSGPLVLAVSPTPIDGGEQAINAAFAASRARAVEAPSVTAAKAWSYTTFGTEGVIADRSEATDLGVTFVRFANGVRLTVKPTDFRDDQILVSVRVAGGRLAQPKSGSNLSWAVGSVFPEGGLGRLTAEELEQVLAGRVYGAALGVSDDAFVLSGRTRPDDFELQMQVLAAYMSDPAWRPEPWARLQSFGSTFHDQLEATAGGVFSREGSRILRSGDTRWGVPTRGQIAAGSLQDVQAAVGDALARNPVEVIIVGDVTVEDAIRRTAATFGALPSRPTTFRAAEGADRVSFPSGGAAPVELRHKGRADQGLAFMAWPVPDFPSDPQRARTLRVLEQVLRLRLTALLRESQGVTYSPSTALETGWEYPGYGYISASVEAPPEKLDGFFRDVAGVAANLRADLVDADELQRAVRPRVETIQNAKKTNEYWLAQLTATQVDPRRLDAIRQATSGLEAVTPEDVRRAAREWLVDGRIFRMVVLPEAAQAD